MRVNETLLPLGDATTVSQGLLQGLVADIDSFPGCLSQTLHSKLITSLGSVHTLAKS